MLPDEGCLHVVAGSECRARASMGGAPARVRHHLPRRTWWACARAPPMPARVLQPSALLLLFGWWWGLQLSNTQAAGHTQQTLCAAHAAAATTRSWSNPRARATTLARQPPSRLRLAGHLHCCQRRKLPTPGVELKRLSRMPTPDDGVPALRLEGDDRLPNTQSTSPSISHTNARTRTPSPPAPQPHHTLLLLVSICGAQPPQQRPSTSQQHCMQRHAGGGALGAGRRSSRWAGCCARRW
jgi:hypothetical protein